MVGKAPDIKVTCPGEKKRVSRLASTKKELIDETITSCEDRIFDEIREKIPIKSDEKDKGGTQNDREQPALHQLGYC